MVRRLDYKVFNKILYRCTGNRSTEILQLFGQDSHTRVPRHHLNVVCFFDRFPVRCLAEEETVAVAAEKVFRIVAGAKWISAWIHELTLFDLISLF